MLDIKLRRFLAVNCALNGHDILEAFDNDIQLASEGVAMDASRVKELSKQLLDLESGIGVSPVVAKIDNPFIMSLINYLRVNEYTFVMLSEDKQLPFNILLQADRYSGVDAQIRDSMLAVLQANATDVDRVSDVGVRDNFIYAPENTTRSELRSAFNLAYTTMRDSPVPGKSAIMKYCENLTVSAYKNISAADCRGILTDFVRKKVPASLYRRTCLFVPDLLQIYKKTGCLMSYSTEVAGNIDWVLVTKKNTIKVVSLKPERLSVYIVDGVKSLASAYYDTETRLVVTEGATCVV